MTIDKNLFEHYDFHDKRFGDPRALAWHRLMRKKFKTVVELRDENSDGALCWCEERLGKETHAKSKDIDETWVFSNIDGLWDCGADKGVAYFYFNVDDRIAVEFKLRFG